VDKEASRDIEKNAGVESSIAGATLRDMILWAISSRDDSKKAKGTNALRHRALSVDSQ
jgi:hypothetical protein